MKKIKWICLTAILFSLACNSSKITSSWKAPNIVAQKFNKIMVLALVQESDRRVPEKMEEHLMNDLLELGYPAVSAIHEFGPKVFDKLDESAAISKLKGSGVDAVLTVVLLDKQKENKYVPGHVYYSPYVVYSNRFWGYRTTLYNRIYEPGYYVTNTKYFWESNLYDMATQKLIYSAQTESFDPGNAENMSHEYGLLIVGNMVKKNVLRYSEAKETLP
jgi:hypothetical protein